MDTKILTLLMKMIRSSNLTSKSINMSYEKKIAKAQIKFEFLGQTEVLL